MGNGPQRQPIYDPEELDALNKIFEQAGMPAVDIYGDPLDATSAPIPSVTFEQPAAPEERSTVTQELETLGPAFSGVTRAAEERQAQSDFEQAFNKLVEQRVTDIYQTEAYKTIPELQGLDEGSFELSDKVYDYAREEMKELAETQLGLVPGFPLEGYAPPGQPMQFPRRMAGGILPAPTPAPPIDLPPAEAPTIASALAPQTRVGPVIAEREEMLSRIKTAEEMIEEQGLDPELHIKSAELERLSQLEQARDLTPAEQGQIVDLTSATEGKEAFDDITQIAQIKGFEDALKKYYANESVARTQSQKEAAQFVLEEIQALGPLLEGKAPPNQYKEHIPGTEYDSALASAFAPQVKRGRVPIISKVQEDYLKAYRPIIEQAYVDVLPYELQAEEAGVAPIPDEGPPDIGEVVPAAQVVSAFDTRPTAITLEEAKANYDQRLRQALDKQFFAIDFWEDPDKYAQGWSWWNQSYPSGASVEGPGSVLLRWSFAPANVLSRAVYDSIRAAEPVVGLVEGQRTIAEPSDVAKIAAGGMDPRYAGHPYLRNIAENRSMMDDLYDLYWYNGNKEMAYLAGGVGLVTDMFLVPFDPGITQTAKGLSAATKSAVIAKSLGMPLRAKDVGTDFAKAVFSAYGDSSPALKRVQTEAGFRMLDPAEYGATRAADFMKGANAYRAAFDDALIAKSDAIAPPGTVRKQEVTYEGPEGPVTATVDRDISGTPLDLNDPIVIESAHEAALNAAAEALNVGPRGNPFLDFARKKGSEWADRTVQELAANTSVGAEAYNKLVDDLWRYMSGKEAKIPKVQKLVDAYEALYGKIDVRSADELELEQALELLSKIIGPEGAMKASGKEAEDQIKALFDAIDRDIQWEGTRVFPEFKYTTREASQPTQYGLPSAEYRVGGEPITAAQARENAKENILALYRTDEDVIESLEFLYDIDPSAVFDLNFKEIFEQAASGRSFAKSLPDQSVLGAKLRKIYSDAGVGGFAKLLEPLNYKTAQSAIVTALDANPVTRGSWRNLRQVTESLMMTPAKIKEFTEVVKANDTMKTLLRVQQDSPLRNGLHKNLDARITSADPSSFNPKVGTFYKLDVDDADALAMIVDDLKKGGYLSSAEARSITNPLLTDFADAPSNMRKTLEEQFGGLDGTGYIISTDNMRRVISAQLEKIAFDNKFGVGIEAFEQAATVTKKALLEPIEARHLAAAWPKRIFSKLFGAVGDKSKWRDLYQEGTPINVVRALDKLRGGLATMNIILRRDIEELLKNDSFQKAYFSEEWLANNEVSRNDAIVALALGPKALRARSAPDILHNISNIMLAKSQDVALDVMDAFRRSSVQRANIADSLSLEGKARLKAILDDIGIFDARVDVDYATWSTKMQGLHDELKKFINTAEYFTDPTAKFQLAAPDFSSITAGFYYLQQQKRLVEEALSDIAKTTDGFAKTISDNPILGKPEKINEVFAAAEKWGLDDLALNKRVYDRQKKQDLFIDAYDGIMGAAIAARMTQMLTDRASPSLAEDLTTSLLRMDYISLGGRTDIAPALSLANQELAKKTRRRKFSDVLDIFKSPKDVYGILQLDRNDALPIPLRAALKVDTLDEFIRSLGFVDPDMMPAEFLVEQAFQDIYDAAFSLGLKGDDLNAVKFLQSKTRREMELDVLQLGQIGGDPGFALSEDWSNIVRIYDEVSEIAETIIRQNNLNSTTLNQNLSFIDDIFKNAKTLILGEPGQTRQFTQEVITSTLESPDVFDLNTLLDDYLVGIKLSDEIKNTVNSATQVKQIRQALDGLFQQNQTAAYKAVKAIDSTLTWLTRARYATILAGRPAFHAVNVLTAPLLVWGTLGGRTAIESVQHAPTAIKILTTKRPSPFAQKVLTGTTDAFPEDLRIAVTDPFGRQYTYRDVYDLALGQGALRSRTAITLSPTQYQEMLDDARFDPEYSSYVKRGMSRILGLGGVQAAIGAAAGLPSPTIAAGTAFQGVMALPGVRRTGQQLSPRATKISQFLTDMTEWEDQIFRLATVIGALKRGDDPTQALATGRRALYDYGSLSQPEKWAMSRFAMFYSFWRLNLGNTLGLMFSNPKRLVNIYRAVTAGERSLRALGGDDNMQFKTHELEFYQHSFLLSRPVIKYVEGIDRNTYYEVMPGVPVLDAMTTIAQIMFAPTPSAALEPFRGFLDPTVRAVTGMEQTMVWRKKYVDPKDMYIMDKTAWGGIFWDSIIGEKPQGRPARSGEESWNGQQWTLSPAAFERYLTFKNQIAPFLAVPNVYTGSTLPFTLMVSGVVTGGDPELTGRRFPDGRPDPLSVFGIVRDVGGVPISEQRRRQLREMARRLQALEKEKTRR